MTYIRRLILALALSAGLVPAFAQVPPPVPALPDTERRTTYSISASTCACNVNFALYGDSTDYANWIEVFVNGVRMTQAGNWTLSSVTGTIGSIPLPITNAVLTFTAPQTGTIQIVGARRPRRTSQFNEGAGVPTRNFNVVLSDLTAQNREVWDKINDVTGRGLFSQPGVTLGPLPLPSACASGFLGFDATGLIPLCRVGAGSGNIVGPLTSVVGNAAIFNNTTGSLLADAGSPPVLTSQLGTAVATFLATPSSANLRAALTDETGTGLAYFQGGALGTPASGTLTSATGLPISTGLTGAGTGVLAALAVNVGSAGAPVLFNGALGTPSSGTLTSSTGLPISTGVSGLGTGIATALGVNIGTAGAPVINGGVLGTPSSGTGTNLTGVPISTGISGLGTNVATALAINVGTTGGIARTIASGSSAMGTGAITSATCATVVTAAATNTATTDVVSASFNGDPSAVTGYIPSTAGMLSILVYPTTNNVNFKVCNNTASSITPGAITLNWRVDR